MGQLILVAMITTHAHAPRTEATCSRTYRDVCILYLLDECPPRGRLDIVVLPRVQAPDVASSQHVDQLRHLFVSETLAKVLNVPTPGNYC